MAQHQQNSPNAKAPSKDQSFVDSPWGNFKKGGKTLFFSSFNLFPLRKSHFFFFFAGAKLLLPPLILKFYLPTREGEVLLASMT